MKSGTTLFTRKKDAEDIVTETERGSLQLLSSLEQEETALAAFYEEITAAEEPLQYEQVIEAKLRSYRRTSGHMLKAYQKLVTVIDELSARWNDLTKEDRYKWLPAAPANARIDMEESRRKHFAGGLNGYKLLLIGYIGSFAGVVIEMLWCLLTRGYLESRAGLVFGPFNLLYGVGAVALTACLYRFRNKGKWISFLGGAVIGSVVEYICSFAQELLFGSRSWDYSHMPYNLNGRICLLYSIFWGLLGVLWVKSLYPRVAKAILKLPDRGGKLLTWALAAFFIINAAVTVLAVYRWSQRIELVEASNALWAFMDQWFPDARMERIFANMNFG